MTTRLLRLNLRRPQIEDQDLQRLRLGKVGREAADDIELRTYLVFDAAKRSRCPVIGYEYLATILVMAAYVGRRCGIPDLEAEAAVAGLALNRAGTRPTMLLDLTTGEYLAIRPVLRHFFQVLPDLGLGILAEARRIADLRHQTVTPIQEPTIQSLT